MITVQEINGQTKRLRLAYEQLLNPLCREVGLPHTALGILLFVANNPDFATAKDICKMRGFKRPIVSTHIERLVMEGYIERKAVPGDRRTNALVCTEKAEPIIKAGRKIQQQFGESLLMGLNEEELLLLEKCFSVMGNNIDNILQGGAGVHE